MRSASVNPLSVSISPSRLFFTAIKCSCLQVWVIDPRDSKILSLWDVVTTTALIYTALLTPFEVGFLSASTTVDVWFVINRLLDVIFILDMMLQFCVVCESATSSYPLSSFRTRSLALIVLLSSRLAPATDQKASGTSDADDSKYVTERRQIVRHCK